MVLIIWYSYYELLRQYIIMYSYSEQVSFPIHYAKIYTEAYSNKTRDSIKMIAHFYTVPL